MDSIFLWLMGGLAGLLLTAGAVAGWEHLRRSVRPQDEFTSATPKVVSIDLRLDRLAAAPAASPAASPVAAPVATAPAPASEMDQRRAALDQVLARLAQPPSLEDPDSPGYWAETTPMVAPGQLEPQEPASIQRPREFSASQQTP